jgi:hypothetical protein
VAFGVLALASLVLLVYSVLDLVSTPASAVRTLPKPVWFLVLLPPLFGPAAWLLAGRPPRGTPRSTVGPPPAPARGAPDDDEEFLRSLRRRAEEQRRRARDPRDDPPSGSPA